MESNNNKGVETNYRIPKDLFDRINKLQWHQIEADCPYENHYLDGLIDEIGQKPFPLRLLFDYIRITNTPSAPLERDWTKEDYDNTVKSLGQHLSNPRGNIMAETWEEMDARQKSEPEPRRIVFTDVESLSKQLLNARNDLYDILPTGEVSLFGLTTAIKRHIQKLDDILNLCPSYTR